MAATVIIDIPVDDWVLVSPTRRGYITNITDTNLTYVEAESKPDEDVTLGHRLFPHQRLPFTLVGIGEVFMRSIRQEGRIALTSGITFYECCDTIIPVNFILQDGNNYVFQDGDNYELN